jgi:hypothetical protein
MSDTIVFEGPDGRLYEIPASDAARYAVPGSRVAELRKRAAPAPADDGPPPGHLRPGDPLPPGVPPPPASASATTTIPTPGGTVVLNFFFAQPGATQTVATESVEGHHMVLEHGIPTLHTDLMYGEYIDKHGASQIGWHSHGPHGNAQ